MVRSCLRKRSTFRARLLLISITAALLLNLSLTGVAAQTPTPEPSRPTGTTSTTGTTGGQTAPPAATTTGTPTATTSGTTAGTTAGTATTPPNNLPPATTAASPAVVPPLTNVRVKEAYRQGYQNSSERETRSSAGIGDIIVVKVEGLKNLVNHAKCMTIDDLPVTTGCHKQELALYLNGREIKGLQPESGAPMPSEQTLQFHLNRNDDSDEAWSDLLGAPPPFKEEFFLRPAALSVGLTNGYALPTDVEGRAFNLVRIRKVRFFLCLIGTIILTGLLLYYAKRTDLLRDTGRAQVADDGAKPFSLGRFQMAFWFYLVIVSFVFIWAITGALDVITVQVLALIGIGAGTALGAAAIDVGKSSKPSTGKFLRDILRDPETGNISFHRFQIFIWTLVLGCIFLHSVWSRLSMPEFDGTLIALMGISAGTYLGFKIPETKT